MFVLGGLTGIMLACAPFDFQVSDTYFVVGHFHWVLIGGTLFGVFSGIMYWFPKVTGRMLSERLAKWQFWLLLIGFILTFRPNARFRNVGHACAAFIPTCRPTVAILEPMTPSARDSSAKLFTLRHQHSVVVEIRPTRRRRSLGRLDVGMGHPFTASLVQLRNGADGP